MDLEKKIVILCQFGYFKELEKYLRTDEGKSEFRTLKHSPLVIFCVQGSRRYKGRLGSDHAATCVILVQNGTDVNLGDSEQRTALHWAVRLKQPSIVGKLIELGGNPTLEDCDGFNACHLSVKLGREECLTALAQSYASKKLLETCDSSGTPPLIAAVKSGNVRISRLLLEHGVATNVTDRRARRSALHYAYIAKHKDLFKILIENGARANIADYKDQQVIHRTCATSDADYLSMILESRHLNNTDINSLSSEGYTPLMMASMNGRARQVSLLLNQPTVQVSTIDKAGRTALHYSSGTEDITCARLITGACNDATRNLKCENGFTVLNLAIIAGNVSLVEMLINHGLDVKNRDCEQHSLLHWATVCGKGAIMDLMLKHCKDDVNVPDSHHAYPLHYAAQMTAEKSVIDKLLESGANVHNVDAEGRMAIQWAASSGNSHSCLYLMRYGADVNVQDRHGLAALHCAASQGHSGCIETLVEQCGAALDITDKDGCTPLFYATNNGHLDAVRMLLKLGARTDIKDSRGRGLGHCAAVSGSVPLLELLHHHSVDLWSASHKGEYPLHDAAQHSHTDFLARLLEQRPDCVDLGNFANRTCLHIAALTNNESLCALLLAKGASVNALMTNKDEKLTAYDVTVLRGHKHLTTYLYTHGGLSAHSVNIQPRYRVHFPPSQIVQKSSTFPNLPTVTLSDHTNHNTGSAKSTFHHSHINLTSPRAAEYVRREVDRVSGATVDQSNDSSCKFDTSGNYNYFHQNSVIEGDGIFSRGTRNYSSECLNTTATSSDICSIHSVSVAPPLVKTSIPCENDKVEDVKCENIHSNHISANTTVKRPNKANEKTLLLPAVTSFRKCITHSSPKILHSNSLPDNISPVKNSSHQHDRERAKTEMGFLLSKPQKSLKVSAIITPSQSDVAENGEIRYTPDENSMSFTTKSKQTSMKPFDDKSKPSRIDDGSKMFSYLRKPGYYYGASVPVRPKYHHKAASVSKKNVADIRNSVKAFEQQRRAVPQIKQMRRVHARVRTRSLDGLAAMTGGSNNTTFDSITTDELMLKPLSEWEAYINEITSGQPENAKGNLEFLRSLLKVSSCSELYHKYDHYCTIAEKNEKEEKMKSDLMTAKSQTDAKCRQMSAVIKHQQELEENEKDWSEADMQRLIERTEMLFDKVTTQSNEMHNVFPTPSPDALSANQKSSNTTAISKKDPTRSYHQESQQHNTSQRVANVKTGEMKSLMQAYRPNIPKDMSCSKGQKAQHQRIGVQKAQSGSSSNTSIHKISHPKSISQSADGDQKYDYVMTKYGMTKIRASHPTN